MKRYGIRYEHDRWGTIAILYVTRWGRIARWLPLPDRSAAKFVEGCHDCRAD